MEKLKGENNELRKKNCDLKCFKIHTRNSEIRKTLNQVKGVFLGRELGFNNDQNQKIYNNFFVRESKPSISSNT